MITMTEIVTFQEVATTAEKEWGFSQVCCVGHALEGAFADFRHFVVCGMMPRGKHQNVEIVVKVVDRYTGPIQASAI